MASVSESVQVRLRGVSSDDDFAVTRLLEGDTELALRTATMPIPYTIEDARAFLSTADPQQIFAIIAGDELVGLIGMTASEDQIEIGYWIGRVYWGRGYATSAVRLLIREAQRRGISRLVADVFPDNFGSMRVLEKSGFVRRRQVQRDLPQRGGLRELIRFEWEQQV